MAHLEASSPTSAITTSSSVSTESTTTSVAIIEP